MISDLAVRRPVFAAVSAILLCVIGIAAFFLLPIRELPNVDPPVVSVSTTYTGASAEVIESRVTEVIERQIAGIQGVDRITSTSRDGQSRISIEFSLDRNIDDAANDVRDAVSRVSNNLPDEAEAPQVAKADADSSPVIILNLSSTTLNRLQLTDYADRYLVERFSTVPGVAQANIFGEATYAMRIWLDADALAARGLTVSDVQSALQRQNAELPAGFLESKDKDFTIRVERGYATPEDFANLPITATGAAGSTVSPSTATTTASTASPLRSTYVTRLGDVARIEEGAEERRRLFRGNGHDQVAIGITRQSQANDLQISKGVRAVVDEMRSNLPEGTQLVVAVDNSEFTSEAIREVWITIGIAIALVSLVNFIFLGTMRAAFIPSIVAPICLLSTFIVLAPLGFSINLLTLLGLVLAIGLVVDDAIVVTENIQRRIDKGEPPVVAAERGTRQVFFAVVATTIVLLSVFAPLLFLPGQIGRLFVELAAAIASAVAFSAFLAFTLSPMLASKILRPAKTEGWLARRVDAAMDGLRESYRASLDALLGTRVAAVTAGSVVLVIGLAAGLLFLKLPQELVPNEDRGRVDVSVQGPVGAGFDYTAAQALKLEPVFQRLRDAGEVERYLVLAPSFGGGQFNSASGVLILSPWGDRTRSADDIASALNKQLGFITGARVTASVRGPFQRGGGGGAGGSNVDFIVTGPEYADLAAWMAPVLTAARANPGFERPRLDYEPTSPRMVVDVDREKAAALGVSATDVGAALETMFGSRRATTYIRGGQEYDVVLQTDIARRRNQSDLETLYVRSGSGALVPLSAVVETHVQGDTPDRRRLNRQRAITLTTQLTPGYTVKDAIEWFRAEAAKQPSGPVIQWGGQARDLLESSGAVGVAFGLALLLVFLVLAAQFESWISPAVIMLTVPLAAAGGLFGLFMASSTLNIYSQIGLIILIGVAAKNGILIVEFANQLRDEGRSIRDAVIEAASLRLRPIIMTSIATAFGALPLVLWAGAGAGSRKTIGVVIFAGAMFATLLTLFIVPVFYNLLGRFTRSPQWTARMIKQFEEDEQVANDSLPRAAE
ncbi:MAG: efflux RND transporter permease subunit [Caulobacteraceae bacterium]|nr:efflux RND transporter permease subunit [Caulobacteraceae bacterium]